MHGAVVRAILCIERNWRVFLDKRMEGMKGKCRE